MPMRRLFSLEGKTAWVTGCKRGIGLAMAEALAEAGADIVGVSRTLELRGSAAEGAARACGRSFHAYRCDFSDMDSVREFAARALRERGTPDILINNAGSILRAPAAEHPDEHWRHVIDVNLNAPWLLAREVGRGMVARGSGKIV